MYRKSTLLMINLQTKSTQMKLMLSGTMVDITVKDALNNAIQEYITVAWEPLGMHL
jgi:CDP-diacylglycerol pyrophosphatase